MRRTLLLFCLLFLSLQLTRGQISRDSLFKRAKTVLYEQPDETVKLALQLLKTEKKVDDKAHLYMLLSNAYIAKRNTDSSLYFILKAADLINTDAQISTKIKILNSVAVQYQQMELFGKALSTLDQAYELVEELPANSKDRFMNSGFIYAVRGMIYRSQSNPELALEKFRAAVLHFQKLSSDKGMAANLSIVFYNMGYCFIDLKNFTRAAAMFQRSFEYALKADARSLEAYALKGQAETSFFNHNYEASVRDLQTAEPLAEPVGDLVLSEGIYRLLADNYLALNNIPQYEHYSAKAAKTLQKREESELKSVDRYLNRQDEIDRQTLADQKNLYAVFAALLSVVALFSAVFLLKALRKQRQKNHRRKAILERFLAPRST